VGFKPTIPAVEQVKIFQSLDRTDTVISMSFDITTYETGAFDLVT
jgi:hypothetical protein